MLLKLNVMLLDLLKDIRSDLGDTCYLGKLPLKASPDMPNGIYISLLNVRENAAMQKPVVSPKYGYKDLPQANEYSMDLYIAVTAYNSDYEAGILDLDRVLHYFAANSYHRLSTQCIHYTIHLANLTLEQNLMLEQSVLSSGLPCLIYRVSAARQSECTDDPWPPGQQG